MSRSNTASALSLVKGIGPLARASELRRTGGLAWRLGRPELDAALPGGVPRGRITEWAGPRSAGKTAALRQMVRAVREAGAGTAYVDGTGTLAPAPWVLGRLGPGGAPPFWVVRPPSPDGVLPAAEELIRSGVFGLVVAEDGEWSRTVAVRLQRLARGSGVALVAVVDRPGRVPLAALRVRFQPAPETDSCRIQIRGLSHSRRVLRARELPYRLPLDCGLADRRGAGRAEGAGSERRGKPRR